MSHSSNENQAQAVTLRARSPPEALLTMKPIAMLPVCNSWHDALGKQPAQGLGPWLQVIQEILDADADEYDNVSDSEDGVASFSEFSEEDFGFGTEDHASAFEMDLWDSPFPTAESEESILATESEANRPETQRMRSYSFQSIREGPKSLLSAAVFSSRRQPNQPEENADAMEMHKPPLCFGSYGGHGGIGSYGSIGSLSFSSPIKSLRRD
eukprot:TRINITY_DN23_c0_g1_i14.p1 TRINITY_DN23_c0_g1~~TRINITY_DN23_c0_g1_i14.p1  ORF type:complete len:211 (+),score=50.30 TRINITY_DN23_c0_g1_i14:132-764(+)